MTDSPGEWPPRVSVARVLELHASALDHAGGSAGVREPGLLEGAVDGALTAALYAADTGEPEPLHLAAHLLCYLARNHALVDGNKRVAWLACEDQLRLLRLRVSATTDDAERLVLDVVERRLEAPDVIEWLAARLTSYDP